MKFRYGDRVWIKNLKIEGEIIEVRTRSIIVRFLHKGDRAEQHFVEDDLTRLPTTKEKYFEETKET